MNELFFMLMELIIINHLTLGNESISQKVYLKFGRGMAKYLKNPFQYQRICNIKIWT